MDLNTTTKINVRVLLSATKDMGLTSVTLNSYWHILLSNPKTRIICLFPRGPDDPGHVTPHLPIESVCEGLHGNRDPIIPDNLQTLL